MAVDDSEWGSPEELVAAALECFHHDWYVPMTTAAPLAGRNPSIFAERERPIARWGCAAAGNGFPISKTASPDPRNQAGRACVPILMDLLMRRMARICALVAVSCMLAPGSVAAADLLGSVEEAYAFRQLRRTPFEPRAARRIEPSEARFLEALFASTDEAALFNTDVDRWLTSHGERGLHPADYLDRMDALRARLDGLQPPGRIASVHRYVTRSLELQRSFVAEWYRAREQGRELESQRTDEFAYHEGLHRSRRLLLKAFAELRALYPDAEEDVYRSFHDHLRAVGL